MIKDFNAARRDAKEALAKQELLLQQKESELVRHREYLNTIKNAFVDLNENDPDALSTMMTELILMYTIKVQNLEKEINSIRVNVSSIRRALKEQYSLAPAIR